MMRIINLDNVSCCYGNNILLRELNFGIDRGSFVSVIGRNGSGKSVLVKVLAGIIPYNGYISINGYYLNKDNINNIRKYVKVIFNDIDNYFIGSTVRDELIFSLKSTGWDLKKIKLKFDEIVKEFRLENIIDKEIYDLTNSEKQIVSIASAFCSDINILIMDDCLNQLNVTDKKFVLDIISNYKKKKKLTVIMVTHNMNDVLYSDRVICLDAGNVVMDGGTVSVLKQSDKLLKYGVGSTFVVDLSLKLIELGIIDHVYLDMERLVDRLWK